MGDNIICIMVYVVFYFLGWLGEQDGRSALCIGWIDQQVAPWYFPSPRMRLVLPRHPWPILLASKSEHLVCTIARTFSLCRFNGNLHDFLLKWSPSQLVFPVNTRTVNRSGYLLKRVSHPLVSLLKIEKYIFFVINFGCQLDGFLYADMLCSQGKILPHLQYFRNSSWATNILDGHQQCVKLCWRFRMCQVWLPPTSLSEYFLGVCDFKWVYWCLNRAVLGQQ
jgi:hypothetical protein